MSIEINHVITASPEQMLFIIEGMRNPLNSWGKIDSYAFTENQEKVSRFDDRVFIDEPLHNFALGHNDMMLMRGLCRRGGDHRKFMRMIPIYMRVTAPLYWWKEFDTYKVGTVRNSCSTMHRIHMKEFSVDDFSDDQLLDDYADDDSLVFYNRGYLNTPSEMLEFIVEGLNKYRKSFLVTRDKKYWWQMIQLLPSSYNQTANVMLNYEVANKMYKGRYAHKLNEWVEFCELLRDLPHSELITMDFEV